MIIDAHAHHVVPPYNSTYLAWLKKTGNQDFGPIYLWNNPAFENGDLELATMDEYGIDTSIITYSANITQIVDAAATSSDDRAAVVSDINDRMLAYQAAHPERIVGCALIDPRLGDAALAEIERVGGRMKALSVIAAYTIDGSFRFLDDPVYEPFWAKAEENGAPVFIHFTSMYKISDPNTPLKGFMADMLLDAGMGQLMEDTLCLARLALSGLFDRHPSLKIVMGQLGGLYPQMIERFGMLFGMYLNGAKAQGLDVLDKANPDRLLRNLSDYLGAIYVDTHSMDTASVLSAIEHLGADHVLYGSDYPITPAAFGMGHGIGQVNALPEHERAAVFAGNAQRLLGL